MPSCTYLVCRYRSIFILCFIFFCLCSFCLLLSIISVSFYLLFSLYLSISSFFLLFSLFLYLYRWLSLTHTHTHTHSHTHKFNLMWVLCRTNDMSNLLDSLYKCSLYFLQLWANALSIFTLDDDQFKKNGGKNFQETFTWFVNCFIIYRQSLAKTIKFSNLDLHFCLW